MPTPNRKKSAEAEGKPQAGESVPKAVQRTRTKKAAVEPAAETAPIKKTVRRRAPASPAATHIAPAKRSSPAAAPVFDVEAYRAEIEREAYFLWERRGRKHGHAQEDWGRAIEIVRARVLNL
jgi:hypothetical protein